MSLIDDYQLLEISTTASEQEAKTAFRRLARRYHPDKNPDKDTTELFQRLQAAYENVTNAIRQGAQVNDWKPFTFTKENTQSSAAKNRYTHFSSATDKEQEAFIKERQRAYEAMKRNNAHHDKVRDDAIKAARNTLNEKRVKALYEEAFKASKDFNAHGYSDTDDTGRKEKHTDIPPYQSFMDDEGDYTQPTRPYHSEAVSQPIRLNAAKAAFRAATYIAFFAAGIYSTLYWQSSQQETAESKTATYITGLYPQFRVGINYTLADTPLYAEPDVSSAILQTIPTQSDLQSIKLQGNWLTVRYNGINGWVQAKNIGFGSVEQARQTGCFGQPGIAPQHGKLIGQADGNSRLRILNQLPEHSMLTFESYDGKAPFSIYLYRKQAYAANYIPRGSYRLVLETGSLYHHACNQFLFNDTTKVILDKVDFASTEQTLTLTP
ncbi:J domain-containing protein [Marinomonas sp. M1K-6]|uniref:J domain-containing protein n=1 Tax=Marinomonas profundi TaxID=2726122 RepID=A0A847R7R1_9GAMM|nr:J domain-containing protein [Marinomonas profundi]NLQ16310.1 J domain-containing protein [Marinomonas profundi]UDV03114.1 DnaJ domain-containing protein [Marinomonas profundi]